MRIHVHSNFKEVLSGRWMLIRTQIRVLWLIADVGQVFYLGQDKRQCQKHSKRTRIVGGSGKWEQAKRCCACLIVHVVNSMSVSVVFSGGQQTTNAMTSDKKGYNFEVNPGMYRFEGLSLSSHTPPKALEAAKRVSFTDKDVIAVSYPKSGKSGWVFSNH